MAIIATKSVSQATKVLHLESLCQRLTDPEKNEHFTVYVETPLEFYAKDFIGLLGPSGCGKTTLLTILGLLRSPSHVEHMINFELYVPDEEKSDTMKRIDITEAWRSKSHGLIEELRRRYFGFALQSGELISSLTVRENISFPLQINCWNKADRRRRETELITQFGLSRVKNAQQNPKERDGLESAANLNEVNPLQDLRQNALAESRVNRLSGGEYQRVALARAIAHRPSVVFVDEPTSALNRELAHNALSVMRDLQQHREQPGITFMITHDETLANEFCNVLVRMAPRKNEPAGEVIEVTRRAAPSL